MTLIDKTEFSWDLIRMEGVEYRKILSFEADGE